MEWVDGTIRTIGGWIDEKIYWFVEKILQLIMDLSNIEIFSRSVIDEFASRIYLILGLLMVFKMMISFIQILVNPDKMDDKEQGVTGILKRVVIALVLMFMVPSIFSFARDIQGYVLPVIPKVILGVTIDTEDQRDLNEMLSQVGQSMAFNSFLPFFTYANPQCDGGEIKGPYSDDGQYEIWSVSSAVDHLHDKCFAIGDDYKYKYSWPMSSIVGIYLIFVLIQVAIAMAVRAIKLGICEFVAPIPIASYIDPKTSKQAFDTWVKTSVQVYLDLFIRLIVVYFVLFVFDKVLNFENLRALYASLGNDVGRGALVTLFIILGLLQFVKQAPKFICDMLGIKGSGDIAGMFKGAWGMAGATTGAVTAGLGNATSSWRTIKEGEGLKAGLQKFARGVGSGLAGTTSGLWRGNKAALSGKGFKESFNTSTQQVWARRNQRAADDANGVKLRHRIATKYMDWNQWNDDVSLAEGIQKSISNIQSKDKAVKATMNDKIGKNSSNISWTGIDKGGSSTINSLQKLLNKNQNAINGSHNKVLREALRAVNNNGRKYNGEFLTYSDLGSIQAAAAQQGLGDIANQLDTHGELTLAAQKEIQKNLRSGNAIDKVGHKSNLNADAAITRSLIELSQTASQEFGNVYDPNLFASFGNWVDKNGVTHNGINSKDDFIKAYETQASKVDEYLDTRASSVSASISNSKTAAARASNRSWKDLNK